MRHHHRNNNNMQNKLIMKSKGKSITVNQVVITQTATGCHFLSQNVMNINDITGIDTELVADCFKMVDDCFKIVDDCFEIVDDCFKIVDDCFKTVEN